MAKKKTIRNDLKVVALIGKANTGKSLTMRNVIIEMLKHGAIVLYPKKYVGISSAQLIREIIQTERTPKGEVSELTVILEISNKKILITTYGDEWKGLEDKFKKNADLYVCASHEVFVSKNNGNNLENVTRNGLLITIGRAYYKSSFKIDDKTINKQKALQNEQADFIRKEIYDNLNNL